MTSQATKTADNGAGKVQDLIGNLPTERLSKEFEDFLAALAQRGVKFATEKAGSAADWLTDYAKGDGGPAMKAVAAGAGAMKQGKSPVGALMKAGLSGVTSAIANKFGGKSDGGSGSGGNVFKATNIVEQIDVGVPRKLAYDLWTQFEDFPSFMKKVEDVTQEEDEELTWKAQVFWSHRTWRSTVIEQVPDTRIIWKSEGEKGYVDGAVTFHELGPELTRILVALVYQPRGFFEVTANLWRAQGRRARLELKHFRRHAMTDAILHADEIEGWRGEIRDGEVVKSGEDEAEERDGDEDRGTEDEYEEDEYENGDEDRGDEDRDTEDEYEEDEYENGDEDQYEDEYENGDEDQYEDEDRDEGQMEVSRQRRGGRRPARGRQPVKAGKR